MSPHSGLLRRYPELASLPAARLGVVESPVEPWYLDGTRLWVKRDDANGAEPGGNKARSLEFLLGSLRAGDTVVTVGGIGSTHVLSTAVHANRLGIATRAFRWRHESNDLTAEIDRLIRERCMHAPVVSGPLHAFWAALVRRVNHREKWIPFGGTSPLGMVGHFAAGLELAGQVERGLLPEPSEICVAMGTGGTAAGLAVGLAASGLGARVVAVRCGPRTGVEALHLRWLTARLRGFLSRRGADVAGVVSREINVDHRAYSGGYARPHPGAEELRRSVQEQRGVGLDATYSAKACYAALMRARESRGPVLFWHTFDARWLRGSRVANR